MLESRCIARRFFPGGREEALMDAGNGPVLTRTFSTALPEERVRNWFDSVSRTALEGIVVPSALEREGEGRYRLYAPAGGSELGDRLAPHPRELSQALGALHSAGILHLDLSTLPFARGLDGRTALVHWGDTALDRVIGRACPEVAAGGFCTRAADYHQFGLYIEAFAERTGLGRDLLPTAGELAASSPRRRLAAAASSGLFPDEADPPALPRVPDKPVVFVRSGPWELRDAILNEAVASASRKGWPARIVRCSPLESGRPLPDRPPGGRRAVSASDLLSILFPGITGVNRLLVVDQADFASEDLLYMLSEIMEIRPPHLHLLIGMARPVAGLDQPDAVRIVLEGDPGLASDLPFEKASGGWIGPSWYGPRRRVPHADSFEESLLDPAEVWQEGAFRETAASWEAGLLPESMRSMAAESLLRTGRPAEALAASGEGDLLVRAEALFRTGRAREAEEALMSSLDGGDSAARVRLLSDILLDQGRAAEAGALLSDLDDPDSITRRAIIADLRGNPGEGLRLLEQALASAPPGSRSGLLCAMSTMQMRLGFYPGASRSADEAVRIDRDSADSTGLARSLQERGRVREVTGRWREALEDYRLSALLSSELGMRADRPVEVDLFILETRMGLCRDAARTRSALLDRLEVESSSLDALTLDLVDSYAAVLAGMGATALPAAERGAARAAELGMPLRQGLFLLYKGQLLVKAGETVEAIDALRHSKALAGLLGDRHLALLAGLALAEAGEAPEPGRLRALASELGLASEELEAAVISGKDGERQEALLGLLALPSPMRACALASRYADDLQPDARARFAAGRDAVIAAMEPDPAAAFARMTAPLESGAVPGGPPGRSHAEGSLKAFAGWLPGFLSGTADLASLASTLGLERLSCSPSDGVLLDSGPPAVYASGPGVEESRTAGPLIAAVLAQASSPPLREEGRADDFPEMLGNSEPIRALKAEMSRVARLDLPVLVTGETGTGKELVARGLHRLGCPAGPFIPVDCGAIPEGLLESELFGARKGAYTDVRSDRKGLLAGADGGTLFLDEIGNLAPGLQIKLLRVLETGRYRPLGSPDELEVKFRLIAATNAELGSLISDGVFRADLYYRLSVIVLETPPLRERPSDIHSLARIFAGQVLDGREPSISRKALRKLMVHSWPGNVRELRNVVQRAAVRCDGDVLREEDIVLDPGKVRPDAAFGMEPLEMAAGRHVISVLTACGGSVSRAAAVLQCDPKTVRRYAGLYGDRLDRNGLPGTKKRH